MNLKIKILSIFPKHSALWKYAHYLKGELSKNKNNSINFIDSWQKQKYRNKLYRTITLLKGIKLKDSDVLICVAPLLAKSLIKSNAKLKIIIAHDLYPITVGKQTSFFEKLIVSKTYPYMKHADLILTVSTFCKQEIIKKYGLMEKIKVLHGGIDHNSFKKLKKSKKELREKNNLPLNKKLLLHIGRDDPRKNVDFLLKILKKLGDDYALVKIGDIAAVKNIITVKNIDEKKLCEIYNAVDILAFPSLYEGLGLPPVEAMACGLPVIAANNTGLKEVCIKESLTELDEQIWLNKISKIMQDQKLRNLMIKKGVIQAKNFNWKTYAKNVEKIIKNQLTNS